MPDSNRLSRRQILQAGAAAIAPWSWTTSFAATPAAAKPAVAMRSPHRVEVRPHQGRTAIFVDDKPIPGMSFYGPESSEKIFRDVAGAGIPIFFLPSGPIWKGPGEYSFSAFDDATKRLGGNSRDVWLIARVNSLSTPSWWAQQNPDELTRYAHAPDRAGDFHPDHRNPRQASMASAKWIADVGDMLRALVAHVENSPLADRVLGYMINSGGTEEWVYWGAQFGYLPDYSLPALHYFRDWLRDEYGGHPWIHDVQSAVGAGAPPRITRYAA